MCVLRAEQNGEKARAKATLFSLSLPTSNNNPFHALKWECCGFSPSLSLSVLTNSCCAFRKKKEKKICCNSIHAFQFPLFCVESESVAFPHVAQKGEVRGFKIKEKQKLASHGLSSTAWDLWEKLLTLLKCTEGCCNWTFKTTFLPG